MATRPGTAFSWRTLGERILTLLLLVGILIGALWMAAAETRPRAWGGGRGAGASAQTPRGGLPQESPTASATPEAASPTRPPVSPTPTATASATPAPTPPTATAPPSPRPTPTPCRPPADWVPYRVQPGDTAFRLASLAGISLPRFLEANCLRGPALFIGQQVYLPVHLPTPTPILTPCGPPSDWVLYTVQPGETLYRLAVRFQVPLYLLMHANCLTSPALAVGQRLYVPPGTPTATPAPPTPSPAAPETPTGSP